MLYETGSVPPYAAKVMFPPLFIFGLDGLITIFEFEGPNGFPSSSAPSQATMNPMANKKQRIHPFFSFLLLINNLFNRVIIK